MLSVESRATSLPSGPSTGSASTSTSPTTPSLPSCTTSSPSAFSATTVAAAAASVYGMSESRLTSLTSSPATTTYARLGSFYGTTPYTDPTTTGSYMFGSSTSSFYPSLDSTGSNWTPAVLPHQTSCYPYDSSTLYNPYGDRYSGMDSAARRKNATRETTNTLKAWLYEHRKNPYPTKGEKIMLAIITKMTLTQVSTWFANARRRLKKENKMTWEPRNKTNDCHEEDDADDDKESLNGSEDNLSSSGGIGDNSTTTSLLTPLPPQHHHHHSVPSSGPSSVVNQVNNNNNSSHALVPHHLQSHANQNVHQQQQLQPLHHRTTASSSSSPPPSPRSLLDVKTDSGGSLMEGRTSGDSSSLSCDKNHSRMKAPSSSLHSSDRFADHHHNLLPNSTHVNGQGLHQQGLHHQHHQAYHPHPHHASEVITGGGQYSSRSPPTSFPLLSSLHPMKHPSVSSSLTTPSSSSPPSTASLHPLQPPSHPLSQYSAQMHHHHGSPHQFLYHPQHASHHMMRRNLMTDDMTADPLNQRPKIWSLAHVATSGEAVRASSHFANNMSHIVSDSGTTFDYNGNQGRNASVQHRGCTESF